MADKDRVEHVVERVVSRVLEDHIVRLRADLVRQVVEHLGPQLAQGQGAPAANDGAVELLRAVSAVQAGSTQKEILRSLLDGTGRYCGRSALFVIKGSAASGWQARGFSHNEDLKDFALQIQVGVAARAMESRAASAGTAAEMDPAFIGQFGAPADGQVLVLPLLLKDKIAALVYADAASGTNLNAGALELLVTATSGWLEVASLRKQAQKEGTEAGARQEASPAQNMSSFSDPFAGHAPAHALAVAVAAPAGAPLAATSSAPAAAAAAQISEEDADTYRKAQRFARLLVDEIKLYNQAKIADGRRHRDLYDRLKDDIEKSRSTYQKRYGNTVAARADYFNQELVRSLAEDDGSLMGANFRR
jgi:hypothetical protein